MSWNPGGNQGPQDQGTADPQPGGDPAGGPTMPGQWQAPPEWQGPGPGPTQPSYPGQAPPQYPGQPPYPGQPAYPGPIQPSYPPPAPPSKRGQYIRLGILAIIAIVIVGGFILFRDRLSNDVTSLQPGECFDQPTETTVTDVQRQPCNEPHDAEVFVNITHSAAAGAPYPGAGEFGDLVQDECTPAYESYTGRTYSELFSAGYDFNFFYPTNDGWTESNDRGVTCFAVKSDNTKMTGSLRNIGSGPATAPSP